MPADYQSTARALALPLDDPDDFEDPLQEQPAWSASNARTGRSLGGSRHSRHFSQDSQPTTTTGKLRVFVGNTSRDLFDTFSKLSPLWKVLAVLAPLTTLVIVILLLVYRHELWNSLIVPAADWMRSHPAGWLVLWSATFFVSFPPMFGYSTCVTGAGYVFGIGKGWLIAASGTIIGSTAAFVVCQTFLRSYASRLASRNKAFAALSATLHQDGIKLLCMIRLCPLPYSLSNGAIAAFPAVRWPGFMFATATAAPKLFIHVFIGNRLAVIAESGGDMDWKTRLLNWGGIFIGIAIGVVTGVVIYRRTQRRAAELEAQSGAAVGLDGDVRSPAGISLRDTPADEDDDYRDYLSEEELGDEVLGPEVGDVEAARKS